MKCECGYTLKEYHIFCPNCGKKVVKQQTANNTNLQNNVSGSAGWQKSQESSLLMSLDGLCLYKGKQPIGVLKIYSDKVEFVHSGRNYATAAIVGGLVGGLIASSTTKVTDVVDCFSMKEIAAANKSKHPSLSSYVEIIFKDGKSLKYLDRSGKHSKKEMFEAVDTINAQLANFS